MFRGRIQKLHVIDEPIELVDEPPSKRKTAWCQDVLKYAEKHEELVGSSRERNKPNKYVGYVALMSHISDSEASSYEEDAYQ